MLFREVFTPLVAVTGTCLVTTLGWCLWPARPIPVSGSSASARPTLLSQEPIQPIFPVTGLNTEKVALGKRLFNDSRLSHDNTISCASCHSLQTAGVDRRVHSVGIHKLEGKRNAPTVFNAVFNYRQFWDGRAASLEEQAAGPVAAPVEMGTNWPEVVEKLQKDTRYVAAFHRLYPQGIQPETITDAIATYERTLVTPDAPFDQFLNGHHDAISEQVQRGYQDFKSYGCVSCHQGRNVGGNLMQPFGVMVDPDAVRKQALRRDHRLVQLADLVRLTDGVAGTENLQPRYKVPSLRNVARTGPYFHDGSTKDLSEAVKLMGLCQLGRRLPESDVNDIVAFLESLTGTYEGKSL